MAPGEANPFEPQQYKTIVLRTSIHCPGCSKKVKRIIKSIPGIHDFVIDPSLNKVTITGDVEADIIIKKFLKFNKQIELWPEKKLANANAKTNSDDKNQSNETNTSDDPSEKKPDERFKEKKPSDKSVATATATDDDPKIVDVAQEAAAEAPSKSDNGPDPKSLQGSGGIPKAHDSNNKSENQEAKSSKKTEKMVQKEINNGDRATEGIMTSLPPLQPPQNMMYNMPTTSYVMSYNMAAQPSTTHSYYAFPATSSSSSSPPPPEFFYGPQSEWGSQAPPPPPESYHMFNDENANSCNVM